MALPWVPTSWGESDGTRPGVSIRQEGVSRGESKFPRLLIVDGRPEAIDNQEPWEPTFPAGYTFLPDINPRPISIALNLARWNPGESHTATPKAAPTPPSPRLAASALGAGGWGMP